MLHSITHLMHMLLRKLHISAVQVFAIRMLGAVVAYGSQLIIARWLSPHDNGIYIQYMSVLAILIPFFTMGFETSPQFFINQYKEKKDYPKILGFIRSTKLISLLLSIVFIGMSYVIGVYFEVENEKLFAILLIGSIAIPWSLIEIQGGIARCWNWMWLAIAPSYLFRFLVLAIVCLVYLINQRNSSYIDALQLTFFATSIVFIVQFVFLKILIKKAIPDQKKLEYQNSSWIKYGVPVAISNVLYIALSFSDVLIIGQIFTPQDVAVYYIASKTIIISVFIIYAIGVSASQKFSQHYATNNFNELQNSVTSATRNSLFFTLITSSFLMIFGYWILYLFGAIYLEGYKYILLLSIVPIIRSTIGPADRLMLMAKAEGVMARNIFVILCITILFQIIGALLLGVVGVAFGSIIACVIETIIVRNSAKKTLGIECFFFLQKKIELNVKHDSLIYITDYNNIFFNPKYLRPFSQYLQQLKFSPFILYVENATKHILIGEIPLISRKIFGLNAISAAVHKSAVLGTPNIHKGEEFGFCTSLLKTLKFDYKCSIFSAYYLNNTNLIKSLFASIAAQNYQILYKKFHNRAILDISTAQNGGEYLVKSISSGRLKEYRRLYRRLSELGAVTIAVHTNKENVMPAFARYLAIEASGWKGKQNTASGKTPQNNIYFEEFIQTLANDDNIQIIEMILNDTVIASGIILMNGEMAYYYKTSFDETYAKFSPGALLTLELTNYLFTVPNLKYVDSCAMEDHSMINKIWRQRQELLDIIITPHPCYSLKWCLAKIYVIFAVHGRAQLKTVYLTLFKK